MHLTTQLISWLATCLATQLAIRLYTRLATRVLTYLATHLVTRLAPCLATLPLCYPVLSDSFKSCLVPFLVAVSANGLTECWLKRAIHALLLSPICLGLNLT